MNNELPLLDGRYKNEFLQNIHFAVYIQASNTTLQDQTFSLKNKTKQNNNWLTSKLPATALITVMGDVFESWSPPTGF